MKKLNANKQFNKQFGTYVKEKRLEFNWSQADLADKIGNNYQNISRLERGEINPTLFWCFKLSAAFEIELSALLKEFEFKIRK